MKGTYILSDYKLFIKRIIEQLKFNENHIFSLPTFENESNLHDWITQLFKDNKIEKLIIPVSIPTDIPANTEGLRIALHIRLNYELSIEQRIIPIILLSDFNAEVILRENNFDPNNNPQNLLFTNGVYLSSFDTKEIKNAIEKAESCSPEDYHIQILNKLKILQKASTGKHSIANAWGCFKLAQVAGLREEIFTHDAISHHLKTLYAKYLICYNDTYKQDVLIDLKPIKCIGKKVLFIDDQADEGWSVLMKSIFKSAGNDFVSVDSAKYKNEETKLFHDFDGFYSECQSHIGKDWDLIIIDLRLNPEKEDIDNEMMKPTEFSGYKLIDEFLKENAGYQIIVSTASNKIWNINAALERGAASYYIKESPEFNYSIGETKKHFDNFKSNVRKCFESSYLIDIYLKTILLKKTTLISKNNDSYRFKQLKQTIKQNLDTAFILGKNNYTIDFALFNYIQILESYCNFFTFNNKEEKRVLVYKNDADKKGRENGILIYKIEDGKIHSNYKYEKDFYSFQKVKTQDKNKQFVNYIKKTVVYDENPRFFSFALKLAAVLDTHLNDMESLRKLMELIYIRNNKIAHSGQNFDETKRTVNKVDVVNIFSVINSLINSSF